MNVPIADARDVAAKLRDGAADRRDIDADQRDEDARRAGEVVANWLSQTRRQLADDLARTEELTWDGADSPDPTPDGFTRTRAHAAGQRGLAEADRVRIRSLVDAVQLQADLRSDERRRAPRDRRAAAQDRRSAADDRQRSAEDRALADRDRDQSSIDREQATPDDLPQADQEPPAPDGPIERAERAMAESAEQIATSRLILARHGRTSPPGEAPQPRPAES